MPLKLKIYFFTMDFVGPQNACIGLGQELLARGHEVCFLANEGFGKKFAKYGFEQRFLKEKPVVEEKKKSNNPVQEMVKQMTDYGFFEAASSLEKLKRFFKANISQSMYEKNAHFDPQLKALLQAEEPDFIIIDSDLVPPSLIYSGIPWAFLFSGNPLGFFDSPQLPPFTSGYPTTGDRSNWPEYQQVLKELLFDVNVNLQRRLCEQFGYPANFKQTYIHHSPYLNIYQYPAELDYDNLISLPPSFTRVDAFCRNEDVHFEIPNQFHEFKANNPNARLIYLSMGSMGSADVQLMRRLVGVLAKLPHFCIVSKGLLHEQYELAVENMWGEAFLPQTAILPVVDLVLTHGGNNTITEAFSFGRPMIVLPLFYDQYDNATRIEEQGFGLQLNPYTFEDEQLIEAVENLLADSELKKRLEVASKRIQTEGSKTKVAILIENIVNSRMIGG